MREAARQARTGSGHGVLGLGRESPTAGLGAQIPTAWCAARHVLVAALMRSQALGIIATLLLAASLGCTADEPAPSEDRVEVPGDSETKPDDSTEEEPVDGEDEPTDEPTEECASAIGQAELVADLSPSAAGEPYSESAEDPSGTFLEPYEVHAVEEEQAASEDRNYVGSISYDGDVDWYLIPMVDVPEPLTGLLDEFAPGLTFVHEGGEPVTVCAQYSRRTGPNSWVVYECESDAADLDGAFNRCCVRIDDHNQLEIIKVLGTGFDDDSGEMLIEVYADGCASYSLSPSASWD